MKKELTAIFMKQEIVTLAEISEHFNCPTHTAKYNVKKLGAVTSINHNAKYYSLPEIIDFDENGLWKYKKIIFSKYGTLKATISGLVNYSDSGLSVFEISKLLAVKPHTLLSAMIDEHKLTRVKHAGCYIYFSVDEERYNAQLQKRTEENEQHSAEVVPDAIGILALVEFMQKPDLNLRQLTGCLNRKGVKITESLLRDFLGYHDLFKKL